MVPALPCTACDVASLSVLNSPTLRLWNICSSRCTSLLWNATATGKMSLVENVSFKSFETLLVLFSDYNAPFAQWSTERVCNWLEDFGLGQYVIFARQWVTSGHTLLTATPQDMEKVTASNCFSRAIVHLDSVQPGPFSSCGSSTFLSYVVSLLVDP